MKKYSSSVMTEREYQAKKSIHKKVIFLCKVIMQKKVI